LAHIVVHLSLFTAISHPEIEPFLNIPDELYGISPLQVAVSLNNYKMVVKLISKNCQIDHVDNMLNTVFHYARSSSSNILKVLASHKNLINVINICGFTPLHLACYRKNFTTVEEFLNMGADVNICSESNLLIYS
jgi:ankyrin repeat protein